MQESRNKLRPCSVYKYCRIKGCKEAVPVDTYSYESKQLYNAFLYGDFIYGWYLTTDKHFMRTCLRYGKVHKDSYHYTWFVNNARVDV